MWRSAIIIAAATGVISWPAFAQDKAAPDGYARTGETTRCIDIASTNISVIDDETLLFKATPGAYYLNNVSGSCRGASSNFSRLDLNVFGTTICNGEIIKVVDRQTGIFRGSCALGDFEKLKRVKDEDAGAEG